MSGHNNIKEQILEELGFSKKVVAKLYRANILTVADLISLTDLDLMNVPNLGHKSIEEIFEVLKKNNLSLKTRTEDTPIKTTKLSDYKS
jgi:DNA-directed RNA polymerase alpha subunit